jgi:predicted dehydrogenase
VRVPEVSPEGALRVAVVGAGGWGEQHARIFSRRSDTALVAVVGRTKDKTDARAAAYGAPGFTDIDEMLDATHPELVTVCLPNEGHFAVTRQLLQRGIPLLVEKPLVFSLEEADELLGIASANDVFFGINFNHRFAEPVQRALAAINDGRLGAPVFATWRFGGEANHGNSPHANLIETQCHGLDMLELFFGPISSVMAQMTNKTYGAYSTIAVALEFANGAVGTLLGSYDSSYAYPDSQLVELNGTLGRAVIHDTVRSLSIQTVGDEVAHVWQAGYFNDEARYFAGTFDRHVDRLVPALKEGAPPPVPAAAGRRALELAEAIIRSHQTGERVGTLGAS